MEIVDWSNLSEVELASLPPIEDEGEEAIA